MQSWRQHDHSITTSLGVLGKYTTNPTPNTVSTSIAGEPRRPVEAERGSKFLRRLGKTSFQVRYSASHAEITRFRRIPIRYRSSISEDTPRAHLGHTQHVPATP